MKIKRIPGRVYSSFNVCVLLFLKAFSVSWTGQGVPVIVKTLFTVLQYILTGQLAIYYGCMLQNTPDRDFK